jgi:transcriptional regulator with XRE-family HTH domain
MQRVKEGFGRTMSRLPQVFGVSRQTLYNWLNGETPSAGHEARLRELVAAADVFRKRGITPTSPMLLRSILNDKNFLELLAGGADGRDTAEKLVRIVRGGEGSRGKLEQLLAGQRPGLMADDMGTPAFDESS